MVDTRTASTTPDVDAFRTWTDEYGNVMTPDVVDAKRVTVIHDGTETDVYIELARGRGLTGGGMWGVSAFVEQPGDDRPAYIPFDMWADVPVDDETVAQPFHNEGMARAYYQDGIVDRIVDEVVDR